MLVLPITTPLLRRGDDLGKLIKPSVKEGDIVVVSSKAVATVEGSTVHLDALTPSHEALRLSSQCNQDPRFTAFVLQECLRMNGSVVGVSPHVLLTSLRPAGMRGRILCPNAGADQSNVEKNHAVGWPIDPATSAESLRKAIGVPVIISDSCCVLGRLGVTAFALACAGIDPHRSEVGTKDLFGKAMRLTQEAVADQLAVAANTVMGNSAQSVPAAVIRNSGIPVSSFSGWVDGIDASEDLFRGILKT